MTTHPVDRSCAGGYNLVVGLARNAASVGCVLALVACARKDVVYGNDQSAAQDSWWGEGVLSEELPDDARRVGIVQYYASECAKHPVACQWVVRAGAAAIRSSGENRKVEYTYKCTSGCDPIFFLSAYASRTGGLITATTESEAKDKYWKVVESLNCRGATTKSPVTCELVE
jgi:hypothetical protein